MKFNKLLGKKAKNTLQNNKGITINNSVFDISKNKLFIIKLLKSVP
jgi:hypothetical protein